MKNILSILTVLALAAAAQAGCGKTATSEGTLKSFDSEKKELVVTVKGKDSTIAVTPETKGAEGLKDIAAGIVLVKEAGGYVTDFQGGSKMLDNGEIVAANDHLHQPMLKLLKSARG